MGMWEPPYLSKIVEFGTLNPEAVIAGLRFYACIMLLEIAYLCAAFAITRQRTQVSSVQAVDNYQQDKAAF